MNKIKILLVYGIALIGCGIRVPQSIIDELCRQQNITNNGTVNGQIIVKENQGMIDNRKVYEYKNINNTYNVSVVQNTFVTYASTKREPVFFDFKSERGYKLDSVNINGEIVQIEDRQDTVLCLIPLLKNHQIRIQAYYNPIMYQIISDNDIHFDTNRAARGDTIRYTINNYVDKQFNKLTINGIETENKGYFVMPDTSVYVKAFYVPIRKQRNIIAKDEHISLYANSAYEGEAVHFGITENEGFSLKNVVINGVKFDKSTRSFVMEDKDVEIALEYEINITDDYKGYDVENVTLDDCHVKTIFYHGKISQRKYISKLNGKTVKIEFYDEFGKLKNTITY